MDEKKEALLKAVKVAVTKYGLSGISTRNIGDTAKVNDAYIYLLFRTKEQLLLEAYEYENGLIFDGILNAIDRYHPMQLSLEEKTDLIFRSMWKNFLADADRVNFCVAYYHSRHFQNASEFHGFQLSELTKRLGGLFHSEKDCVRTMYMLLAILYDSAYAVVSGQEKNDEDFVNFVYRAGMAILKGIVRQPE